MAEADFRLAMQVAEGEQVFVEMRTSSGQAKVSLDAFEAVIGSDFESVSFPLNRAGSELLAFSVSGLDAGVSVVVRAARIGHHGQEVYGVSAGRRDDPV